MPTPPPALPKSWDRDEIPPQKVAQQNIKDLQTRAKLARDEGTAAKRAADLALQKLGNYLLFDAKKNDPAKVAQANAIKPTVIKLYEDARKLSEGLSLPSGKYEVWVTKYTTPKFYHNAEAAGKKAVWSYKYADTGLESINGEFSIEMDRSYSSLKGDENAQAKKISDAAVAKVKSLTKATDVKMVKS
jgi:hypothetical protein